MEPDGWYVHAGTKIGSLKFGTGTTRKLPVYVMLDVWDNTYYSHAIAYRIHRGGDGYTMVIDLPGEDRYFINPKMSFLEVQRVAIAWSHKREIKATQLKQLGFRMEN
jgi:hypothetical protein